MNITVWPGPYENGWDGVGDPPGVYPIIDGFEALTIRWDHDAHCVGHAIPDETQQPRLNLPSLPVLIRADSEPRQGWVFVDLDNPGHALWADRDAAKKAIDDLFASHGTPGGPLGAAGVYSTRAGLRLVWRLESPMGVSYYNAWCREFLAYLSKATGLPIIDPKVKGMGGLDGTCAQWTRCFRLPFVSRENVVQQPVIDLSRVMDRTLLWSPKKAVTREIPTPSAGTSAVEGAPPFPTEADVTDSEWLSVSSSKYYEKMRAGLALATSGNRDTSMIRAIGDIAGTFNTADPKVPWRFLARSIAADTTEDAPTLEKLWDRCQYIANLEANKHRVAEVMKLQPAIVFAGKSYYVWNETFKGYMPPCQAVALVHGLETYCATIGLQTRKPGSTECRPTAELLASYGAPAYRIIAEMGRVRTEYDPDTRIIRESCCVPQQVEATYHTEIDRWLRLIGNNEAEKLLDWLATAMMLDRPTCALYLEGVPGAGKGMLPTGLGALWGGVTMFREAVKDFNGALARSPIVWADESMPSKGDFSTGFRSLIGNTEHPWNRKFLESATIIGAPRLIFSANNADGLKLREKLTSMDIDAIAARILYIHANPMAKVYLDGLGGRTATAEWVSRKNGSPGMIAEHVMWLMETRPVKPGPRFIVEGSKTDFHADLALSHGNVTMTLAAIAHVISRGQKVQGFLYKSAEEVWVNQPSLRNAWSMVMATPAPEETELTDALRAINIGEDRSREEGPQRRYHIIPTASILRVADLLQIGDTEAIGARIAAGDRPAKQGVQNA